MATLQVINLAKSYGRTTVVDQLSLAVHDGEFVTLLGPSGCGKTTVLRAIAGFIEIDSGEIYFDNHLINHIPPSKRSTALVFQSYALFPHMSVRDNVAFGLRMQGVPPRERDERVREVIAMVGMNGLEDRRPGQLSGGQQQRVALARAVVTRPQILLLDEPLSNLDAKLRERLRIEIRELQQRLKITSVYVTHDQAEALVISDRIIVMNSGRIEQIGDPTTIYHFPQNSFTAEFIGQANLFPARLEAVADGTCLLDTPLGLIAAQATPANPPAELMVSWRPEDMLVGEAGLRNRLVGTVQHSIFLGNLTDVLVDVGGVQLRLQSSGATVWQPGDAIVLCVPESKVRVLRASQNHLPGREQPR